MTPTHCTRRGKRYRYYQCVNRDKRGRRACDARPLPANAIESFVVTRIRDVTADGNLADEVTRRMDAYFEQKRDALEREQKKLPALIAELSSEIKKLIDTIIGVNESARRQIETRIDELGQAMAKHEMRLVEVERTLTGLDDLQSEGRWVSGALMLARQSARVLSAFMLCARPLIDHRPAMAPPTCTGPRKSCAWRGKLPATQRGQRMHSFI